MATTEPTLPKRTRLPSVQRPSGGRARARSTSVAWLAHTDLTPNEWEHYGSRLGLMSKSASWWLGDWLRLGQRKYGESYQRASELTGYEVHTLMSFAYVAGRYVPSRRREALSWSHHAELAALASAEQDLWLDYAISANLGVQQLRTALRGEHGTLPAVLSEASVDADDPGPPLPCPHCGALLSAPEPTLAED